MFDRGLFLTAQAVRRQLAAMPHDLYLIRLIHSATKRAFPGERLWTAGQLTQLSTLGFLRVRNREGCDIYVHPYTPDHNSGYVLVDLDHADPTVWRHMRTNGHEPCVVVRSSPGHWQAWVRVSSTPLPPTLASAAGRCLADLYGGDRASTDWRHLGRLAGFTNRKPQRRLTNRFAPWVKIVHATPCFASRADTLLHTASQIIATTHTSQSASDPPSTGLVSVPQAQLIYHTWMDRWRITQRFQPPDWSIVDLWVARALLAQGASDWYVQDVLRWGSPHFPRRHGDPADYLRRTLVRASRLAFSAPRGPLCAPHAGTPTAAAATARSNSAGGQYPSAECNRFSL
jgi:hypothetical protein